MLSFPSAARIMAEVDFLIRTVTNFVTETGQIRYGSHAPALWNSRIYWVSTGFYARFRLRIWLPQGNGRSRIPVRTNHLKRSPRVSPTVVAAVRRPFRCAFYDHLGGRSQFVSPD